MFNTVPYFVYTRISCIFSLTQFQSDNAISLSVNNKAKHEPINKVILLLYQQYLPPPGLQIFPSGYSSKLHQFAAHNSTCTNCNMCCTINDIFALEDTAIRLAHLVCTECFSLGINSTASLQISSFIILFV